MRKHAIILRLGEADNANVPVPPDHQPTVVHFLNKDVPADQRVTHELIFEELKRSNLLPSNLGWDLFNLAVAAFSADTCISRREDSQDGWSREIALYVPVSDPGLWTPQTALLERMLRFLTGDRWRIRFRDWPTGFSGIEVPQKKGSDRHEPKVVSLFSGGLDSFIGAIDILSSGEQPLLIGHYKSGDVSMPQRHGADFLRDRFPDNSPVYVPFFLRTPKEIFAGGDEKTERGRSFLFFAIAVLCATSSPDSVRMIVPENGLISMNVPLTPWRIGASSTRTTHPFYMDMYQQLLDHLGLQIRITNPYQFKTKGEMTKECTDQVVLKGNIGNTVSCASPSSSHWTKGAPSTQHCGHCVPCIIRRAAIEFAYGNDRTPYTTDLKAGVLNVRKSEGNQVHAFKMACGRLRDNPGLAKYLVYKAGPLPGDASFLSEAAGVYLRGMREVEVLVSKIKLTDNK